MKLCVCYYPEQIKEHDFTARIHADLALMVNWGIGYFRVGEFMWSTVEPLRDKFNWHLLDTVMDAAQTHGLKVILGTPSAAAPKWLIVENAPNILAQTASGHPKRFGARRHYSFSSQTYQFEVKRILAIWTQRYANHPALYAWQIDNEYGCHDTIYCYAPFTLLAFRRFLIKRYKDIDTLNRAWGTTFWSQHYNHFDEVDFPIQTVTTPNPSHVLDFKRFSSQQVRLFHELQVNVIQDNSPTDHARPIIHNFMGASLDFDHYQLSTSLDYVGWDNYPLGFFSVFNHISNATLQPSPLSLPLAAEQAEDLTASAEKGDCDFSALHHDLYRSMGRRGWWVSELQPGAVNWAPYNPIPYRAPDDPKRSSQRLWVWEAFAHGADLVSFFRFRQFPHAQEQYHSALLLPDHSPTATADDVNRIAEEIKTVKNACTLPSSPKRKAIAILFDYTTAWAYSINPQGAGFSFFKETYRWYQALRQLGLEVDFIAPHKLNLPGSLAHLNAYELVILPSNAILTATCAEALTSFVQTHSGILVMGTRSGSLTEDFALTVPATPQYLQDLAGLSVRQVGSLMPTSTYPITFNHKDFMPAPHAPTNTASSWEMGTWLEEIELLAAAPQAQVIAQLPHNQAAITAKYHPSAHAQTTSAFPGVCYYFCGVPSSSLLVHFLARILQLSSSADAHTSTNHTKRGMALRTRRASGLKDVFFPITTNTEANVAQKAQAKAAKVRISEHGGLYFALNYGTSTIELPFMPEMTARVEWLVGNATLAPADVSIWKIL